MHRLAYQPCVGRRIPQTLSGAVRCNSTKVEGVVSETPLPSATSARLASSWGDLFIPSREEILRESRPSSRKETHPYTANLQYLDKGSDTSLAARLAKQWRKQEVPAQIPPSAKSLPIQRLEVYHPDTSNITTENKTREPRVDHTIAERRAERLAREKVQKVHPRQPHQESGNYKRWSQRPTQQYEGTENIATIQAGRRLQNNNSQQLRRGGPNSRKGVSQTRPGLRDTGGKAREGFVITRARKVKEDEGGESKEDISLEILEEGCDTKVPSALTTPDIPPADLNAIFGHSSATSLDIISARQRFSPKVLEATNRTQWIRETFGGDYTRFAPQPSHIYIEPHRALSPSKHAELVLSKRRDVLIAKRHRAQDIIQLATVRSA